MKAADVMVCTVISVRHSSREPNQRRARHRRGGRACWNRERGRSHAAGRGRHRPKPFLVAGVSDRQQVLAAEYVKSHSHKVTDVMTRSVITATPETLLGEIAILLERNRIKRVPIVKNGKVVGIVSRANLLQALAGMPAKKAAAASAGDSQIRDQVLSRLNAQLWRPSMLNVTVRDGTVDLWGFVTSDDEKKATRIAVESIRGVKAINDHLTIPPPEIALV